MNEPVQRRAYDSSRRQAAAEERRLAMLEAARHLFSEKGYAGTTMNDIAEAATVAVDTLYASVGTKAELFSLLLETVLSGTVEAIPVEQRNYIAVIRAEPDPRRKLEIYAAVVTQIWGRMAPLLNVLQTGAANDPALAQIWEAFLTQRVDNVSLLVAELEPHGYLRPGLSADDAADTAWAVSSTEVYTLLTGVRGWQPERYQRWLAETFQRLLLGDEALEA